MTPAALSRLTWTADDRRAWNDAYAHARAIDRRRKRLARAAQEKRTLTRVDTVRESYGAPLAVTSRVPDGCTGYFEDNRGTLQHDGPTCPIHESGGQKRYDVVAGPFRGYERFSVHVDGMGEES